LFGYVSTPTSAATIPFATPMGVPYIAPFTDAEALHSPVKVLVFNVRASYFDKTEGMLVHLTKDLGGKKIGVFIQDDGYGNAGKAGVSRAFNKRGLALIREGKYTRNTTGVDAGLAAIKVVNPEAVITVGTYKACAKFVKTAKMSGFNPKFLNLSFVGTSNFIKETGGAGERVYIMQVMPSPYRRYQTHIQTVPNRLEKCRQEIRV
jgi:branched-chain amino acid transport system substrate-binding protein